ncbi:hypothetical protein OKA04_03830 [Luteolibacter flavescens]|uniref:Tetratricopeptide repeat protein n=1 Tax=Luteolibacter flavescens TaxID=1859460 RepID=A0ABT3FJV0_9BACT|nr:hypothetical protein [Luteolibacter flavescens]MCW1883843.1 hypothetical protein [Luteolibacter flavescens]
MKLLTPWMVFATICSLILTDADARGDGAQGANARGKNAAGVSRGPGGNARPAPRSPMTGSRLNRPQARPAVRPQPAVRPTPKPQVRPGGGGAVPQRPVVRPAPIPQVRPGAGGAQRPAVRPGGNIKPMPVPARPGTKPGNVTYPRPGQRPGGGGNIIRPPGGGKPVIRPGGGNGLINKRPVVINRPNFNPRPANRPGWGNNWGNWGKWNNNRPGRPGYRPNVNITNNVNIQINNNFRRYNNWGYRPAYWGSRPWWNANHYHGWHHGSWNYGWNRRWYGHYHWNRPRPLPGYVIYDDRGSFSDGVAWGLAAWGLGNLIYNLGYQTYTNPYPAPPVQSSTGVTVINYREPITVSAGKLPPGDETADDSAEEKASAALEASRAAFKRADYLAALKAADESIAWVPGDTAVHEYRALILFALGKYGEAAGVLNPVLASGPGWDWTTMTGLYGSQTVYTEQLRRLEDYTRAAPTNAAARFLLGYHYLVCAHLDQAYEQFDQVTKLQPADTIAAQLRDLCASSISPDTGDDTTADPPVESEAPAGPVLAADQLVGTWVSDRGAQGGKVTLKLGEDGTFSWSFAKDGENTDLAGTFSIDERGLLVLESDDSQMVGEVKLPADKKLNFVLSGGPQGDPGLDFDKAL